MADFRPPLARARGLGSAKSGVGHFIGLGPLRRRGNLQATHTSLTPQSAHSIVLLNVYII